MAIRRNQVAHEDVRQYEYIESVKFLQSDRFNERLSQTT